MSQGSRIPQKLEEQMTPEVRAYVEALWVRVDDLQARVDELSRRLVKYEKYKRSSQDEPADPPPTTTNSPPRKAKKRRKRGGQPGHQKHERPLIPTEQCHEVISLRPEHCRRCGQALTGDDPDPFRQQVYELPEIELHVTEYQRQRLHCACCGITTCAELPEGVPRGQSGPRLVMFVALLMAMFRQSKRRVSLFCETLLDHPMSPGLIVKLQQQATQSLRPCYEELAAALPEQPVVYADETGTQQENSKAWIWTTVAATFTVFTIRLTKAACVIRQLLGDAFDGVIISDRAKMYHWASWHQWCWAHLKRDFEAMADRDGPAGEVGQRLLEATHKLFKYSRRIRDGTMTERGFYRQISILRGEVEAALADGCCCADRATAATCCELYNHFDNLWVFQYHAGVQPTNNAAERSLRHAVIWKRLSFGTQSAAGSRFVETLLTIIESCRQQDRNLFQFLCQTHQAHLKGQPTPSLLTDP